MESHGVQILEHFFFFLIYVNDLSKIVSDKSVPILFADDTSFIIANCDETEFKFNTNEIFLYLSFDLSQVHDI